MSRAPHLPSSRLRHRLLPSPLSLSPVSSLSTLAATTHPLLLHHAPTSPPGLGAGRPVRAGGGAPLEGKGRQRRRWPPWTPAAMVSPCATALSPLLPYSLTHLSPPQTNPAARRPPWRPVPSSPRRSSGDLRCAWIRADPMIPRRTGGPARGARRRSPPMAPAALEMSSVLTFLASFERM